MLIKDFNAKFVCTKLLYEKGDGESHARQSRHQVSDWRIFRTEFSWVFEFMSFMTGLQC